MEKSFIAYNVHFLVAFCSKAPCMPVSRFVYEASFASDFASARSVEGDVPRDTISIV